jgi:cytidyltransferase-like protein
MPAARQVVVSGGFDNLRSRDVRFLEEASRLGELTVAVWPDASIERISGKPPKFPLSERSYLLNAIRYVSRVVQAGERVAHNELPVAAGLHPEIWVDTESPFNSARQGFCDANKMAYHILTANDLNGFPELPPTPGTHGRKRVVATGCYDWLHSGHVRFAEEASTYGDLFICVGSDANLRLLKGAGHPLLSQAERRYLVGSIKFVKRALITTGSGWLDADPEIRRIQPDIIVVNEDGDRGGKREYCEKMGIEYVVLKRAPAPGLRGRTSTELRGF